MNKTVYIYNKVSLWIVCGLTLLGLVFMQVSGRMSLLNALIISAVFQLACSFAFGQAWRVMADRSPEQLPKLYLAGTAFRLMAAAVVLLVCCVIFRHDIETIKWFAAIFIVFYLAMLVFDAVFFAKVSKNSNK